MDLYSCSDYRAWFQLWLKSKPKEGHGELSKIAKHLEVNSTLISQVLSRSRDFSMEQGFALCEYFSFNAIETRYFMLLLQIERAGTHNLKNYFKSELGRVKKMSGEIESRLEVDTDITDTEKSFLVASWKPTAILVFTGRHGGVTVDEIANEFRITAKAARKNLEPLVKMRLIQQKEGRFHTGFKRLHIAKGSSFLLRHYANWRLRAIDRCEDIADDEIMYTSVSSISEEDIPLLKEKLLSWITQYSKRVSASPAERAICMNLDFFRV